MFIDLYYKKNIVNKFVLIFLKNRINMHYNTMGNWYGCSV